MGGQIVGSVNQVRQLDKQDGQEVTYAIDIETVGFLYRGETPPEVGGFIKGDFSVYWPKGGGRPVRWLGAISRVVAQ